MSTTTKEDLIAQAHDLRICAYSFIAKYMEWMKNREDVGMEPHKALGDLFEGGTFSSVNYADLCAKIEQSASFYVDSPGFSSVCDLRNTIETLISELEASREGS